MGGHSWPIVRFAIVNSWVGLAGAYRTWVRLRDSHPGNGIPFRVVQDFVQACPICQKVNRPMMDNKLESRYRTIKSLLFRKAIGIDHVTITPVSKDGYKGITVIVNMFSGEADLYPYKVSTGEHDARCLHDYFSRKGVFDEIRTDPGTDFKSKILECMEKWYGINHVFSITDRHESNGVERVIKEVIRHLSALVLSERIAEKWSEPEVIASIRLILNTTPLSERGNYAAYVPSSISRAYTDAADSEVEYRVFKGRLTFEREKLYENLDPLDGRTRVLATFDGLVLGRRRFSEEVQESIILEAYCLAGICSGVTSGREYILFVRVDGEDLLSYFDACGGDAFRLTSENEKALLSCHRGGTCKLSTDE